MNFEQELWRRINFPTPEHFQRELIDLYLDAAAVYGSKPLPAVYLAPIIKQIVNFYAVEFPPEYDERFRRKLAEPSAAYKLILSLFTNSLIQFTRVYPYKDVSTDTLFVLTKPTATPEAICDALFAEALYALQAPFIAAQPVLSQHGFRWENWAPYGYQPFSKLKPVEPFDPTKAERYAYRQQLELWKAEKKQYEELHTKAHKLIDPISKAVAHSPYYTFARTLDPGSYTERFEIPEDRWFEGCWIVAASGAGKTNLLRHLILHRLREDATIIILDSKGDLFRSFERLHAIKDRLVVLQTTPEDPLAINPFDTKHPSEFLDYLFSIFNTGLTPHQGIPFNAIIGLLEKIPHPTMETFWEIVVDGAQKYQDAIKELHPRDQRFFEKEIKLSRYTERLGDIQARLRILFGNKCLGPILESKKTRVDMRELLDSSKVICINNSYADLGPFGSEFLGRLFLALIWYAGRERKSKKPVYVFLDEAHYVIANDRHIDDMITQLRSKRISLTFAHQFLRQIDDSKVRGALDTCAIKFFNTTAEPLASGFFPNTTADELATIEQGKFAAFVKFKTTKAEIVPVPPYPVHAEPQTFLDLQTYPLMSEYEHHALLLTMRARYAQEPPAPPPPDDAIYEENHINPNLADRGGTYKTKLRLDVHGREWKWAEIAIPANMKEGYKIKFPGYGAFRRDGTRGDLIHILYRRKSDGPQTVPAELDRKTSRGKRHQSPPPRQEPIEDW